MRSCPGCSKEHSEVSLLCKPCKRNALRVIRRDADDKERMLREEDEE